MPEVSRHVLPEDAVSAIRQRLGIGRIRWLKQYNLGQAAWTLTGDIMVEHTSGEHEWLISTVALDDNLPEPERLPFAQACIRIAFQEKSDPATWRELRADPMPPPTQWWE
jgi:hypothetical protein